MTLKEKQRSETKKRLEFARKVKAVRLPVFQRRMKIVRNRRCVTQMQLGKRLGISHSTISNFETGRRVPTLATFVQLAQALDVSTDYLLGLKEEE